MSGWDYDGELTVTWPVYEDGWNVTARRTVRFWMQRGMRIPTCSGKA